MRKQIEIAEITAAYPNKTVLRDVSLTLWERDFLGVIGPNGGGKTTLLKVILGLLKPLSGRLLFYDQGVEVPSLRIGYLQQVNPIDRRFPISVFDVIVSGLMQQRRRLHGLTTDQRLRVEEVMVQMGLEAYGKRPIGELSGGELQRVLLGRAVVSRPQVLVLDEPNTYVDKLFEQRLYELLRDINKETAIILVSHDVGTMLPLVKNVACVNETIHYHAGGDLSAEWLNEQGLGPMEMIHHGSLPWRLLEKHP